MPFITGVWWWRANRSGVLAGMAAGLLTWALALAYLPRLPSDFLGMLSCLVAVLVVTPFTQRSEPPRPVRNANGEELDLADRLGILPLFRRQDQAAGCAARSTFFKP